MLDKVFGVSKQTFLKCRVFPAHANDQFNDNSCSFCWGSYDDDHPAVRVLPCNHVFGLDCLGEMVDAPNGDKCPLCRTSLFRPSLLVGLGRFFEYGLILLFQLTELGYFKFLVLWRALPRYLQVPLRFCLGFKNAYYYADLIIYYCTNIYVRNPHFNLQPPMWITLLPRIGFLDRYINQVGQDVGLRESPTAVSAFRIVGPVFAFAFVCLYGKLFGLNNWRDSVMVAFIMIAGQLLADVVVAIFSSVA
jgi:hypothetical protein